MKLKIALIDYATGNHGSLITCLKALGYRVTLAKKPEDLDHDLDLVILPGVGAFAPAMASLQKAGWPDYLHAQVAQGLPVLGICLGMQLLSDVSYENTPTKGLGLIPGETKPFTHPRWHIGWNQIKTKPQQLLNTAHETHYYFNHGYFYSGSEHYINATVEYASLRFPATIQNKRVFGFQFHPEKSQQAGTKALQNVIDNIIHV